MSEINNQKRSATTVYVGCRYPSGIILRLFDMVDGHEVVAGGRHEKVKTAQLREEFELNGYLKPDMIQSVNGKGRYGITAVPADFFAEWIEQNANEDLVKNQIVFACDSESDLRAKGNELKDEDVGLSPIDPKNPETRMRGIKPFKEEGAAA